MDHPEIKQLAKNYRKTFGYEFNSTAKRDPKLYISLSALLMMILCLALLLWDASFLSPDTFFVLMLVFELIFMLFLALHGESQKDKKAEVFRSSLKLDKNLTTVELKEKWISLNVKYNKREYFELVEGIEKIQDYLKSNQTKNQSYFDHYIKLVTSWSKPFKVLMLSILVPLTLFILKATLKKESWTTSITSIMTPPNFQIVTLWVFGIVVAGAVVSFLMSMVALAFDYHQDFKKVKGCSESSLEILKYDLVRLSEIKIGSDSDKTTK